MPLLLFVQGAFLKFSFLLGHKSMLSVTTKSSEMTFMQCAKNINTYLNLL